MPGTTTATEQQLCREVGEAALKIPPNPRVMVFRKLTARVRCDTALGYLRRPGDGWRQAVLVLVYTRGDLDADPGDASSPEEAKCIRGLLNRAILDVVEGRKIAAAAAIAELKAVCGGFFRAEEAEISPCPDV